MKKVIAVFVIIGLFVVVPLVEAKGTEPTASADYIHALETANTFLWAWTIRDADSGIKLVSHKLLSRLRKENNIDWLREYFIGLSNPHHSSFEIGKGKITDAKRIDFPVTLYEYYTGEPKAFQYHSKIEIIKEKSSWRVDVLPTTSDNEH